MHFEILRIFSAPSAISAGSDSQGYVHNSFAERNLPMKLHKNFGMLLLGIWLILTGLIPLLKLSFSGLGTLMAICALAAGILITLGR